MNSKIVLSIMLLLSIASTKSEPAEYRSGKILKKYEAFLDKGTYECQDWSTFQVIPKSRYHTFKQVFAMFEQNKGKVIVELGTTRSFTHGGHPGCNRSETFFWMPENPEFWDWGAGFFTHTAAECLAHLNPEFHTIDISAEHIKRCQLITKDFNYFIQYHVCSSVDFLETCNFKNGIDLLYMDTGNITPIEETALLHLQEASIIVKRNLIAPNGIILIDDVRHQTPKLFGEKSDLGKAKYSIPYFKAHGFKVIADEYQVILQRVN